MGGGGNGGWTGVVGGSKGASVEGAFESMVARWRTGGKGSPLTPAAGL